jgi:D-serine deaminase-like pyridoxal phosphate-dependent protein
MDSRYAIDDTSEIISPGVVIFRDIVRDNIQKMVAIARDPARLRPHCKTHKMAEVVKLEMDFGIQKGKAATFAEAEMLARAGVKDVVLAYNMVGPNIGRAATFRSRFPNVKFAVTADHERPIAELGEAMSAAGLTIDVLLDIDCGQHRTGVEAGPRAAELYRILAKTPGLNAAGFHVYDGHQHQKDPADRAAAVDAEFAKVTAVRDALVREGFEVPKLVCGGTASFPIYAAKSDPTIELSPGTCVFQDFGYGNAFPDLSFTPAALLLTRVISRPTSDRVTCDLGYKAVASDPPAGQRLQFPDLPDAEAVLQNEEHLVLKTSRAGEFTPGDVLLAIPRHVCPTSALHKQVFVVSDGKFIDRWDVTSRDRWITV